MIWERLQLLRKPKLEKVNESKDPEIILTPVEALMRQGAIESRDKMYAGWNEVEIIKIQNDGRAIFKAKSGEYPGCRLEIPVGTYHKREVAAYLVDKLLGFGLVPETVLRSMETEVGSTQRFIENAKIWGELTPKERSEFENDGRIETQFYKLWILDLITMNTDRHPYNLLYKDGNIYTIDHGLCFGRSPRVMQDYYDKPMPLSVVEHLKTVGETRQDIVKYGDMLTSLVGDDLKEKCLKRLNVLIECAQKNTQGRPSSVTREMVERFSGV